VAALHVPAGAGPPAAASRDLVDEFTLDASTVRIYRQDDVSPGRVPTRAFRERTGEAVRRSFLEYTLLGVMPGELDIVIVPSVSHGDDANAGPDDRGACVILIQVSAFRESGAFYEQVLAHELFHCFQFKQFGDRVWSADNAAGEWWFEGSAEYFSNVVFPRENAEYQFLDSLRELEPGHALVDLSYEAWVFFQHFANRQGNPAIIEFLETMPSRSGRAGQIAAAAGWPGMNELFHDYAKAFLSNDIVDASGENIPIRAIHQTLGRHVINRPGEIFRIDDLKPFEMHRIVMEFPDGHEYDMEHDVADGVLTAAQEGGPVMPWEELPDPITTCEEPQKWRWLLTTVAPGVEQPAALKVVDITDADEDSPACCASEAEHPGRETRAERRQVRIIVCAPTFAAVFRGGVCWVENGFLMATAGYDVFDSFVEATGPYPRGYAFLLGTAQPGTEAPGHPDVSISDGNELLPYGTSATLTKSDDLLKGTFTSADVFGSYRCPRLTPLEEVRARG
jgi:hypothetical protein